MEKRKGRNSIKRFIMLPVLVLGSLTVLSSSIAIIDIHRVNAKASVIADDYMNNIQELNDAKNGIINIHNLALSHIIATDFDTMIDIVSSIREQQTQLRESLSTYEVVTKDGTDEALATLLENARNFEYAIQNLVAYSANNDVTQAYYYANNDVASYVKEINLAIEQLNEMTAKATEDARKTLQTTYVMGIITHLCVVGISLAGIGFALWNLIQHIVKPIRLTESELTSIIAGINEKKGDLTKRVTVKGENEISALGTGINSFIEKLQSILLTISEDSKRIDQIVKEVGNRVATSSESATDLSALTEELSATMEEVARNTSIIEETSKELDTEVHTIAKKTNEINDYSKEMRENADSMESSARTSMSAISEKVSDILLVLNKAIEDSKSVEQVSNLTDEILSISSQTNLLALNASIEAARAGEAGRGFAVVAEEISKLASSSREAANNIQSINDIVLAVVTNLTTNSESLVTYLNDFILPEFSNMVTSGEQYRDDANYIETIMNEFTNRTEELKNEISEITKSLHFITTSIGDGVSGITGAAESTQTLVSDIKDIETHMNTNQEIAVELTKETEIFTKL